jgi:hypothetical protein
MGRLKDTSLVKVSELLTVNHEWNVPLIRIIFFDLDIDAILCIPLRHTTCDDCLAGQRISQEFILFGQLIEL